MDVRARFILSLLLLVCTICSAQSSGDVRPSLNWHPTYKPVSGRYVCDSGPRDNDSSGIGLAIPPEIEFLPDGTWTSALAGGTYDFKDETLTLTSSKMSPNDFCRGTACGVSLHGVIDVTGEEIFRACVPYGWCGTGACDPGRAVTCTKSTYPRSVRSTPSGYKQQAQPKSRQKSVASPTRKPV